MKNVRHVGIVVTDMVRALRFYRDLLNFTVVWDKDEQGEYIDKMLSLTKVQVRTVKMKVDDGTTLVELLEFKSHPRPISPEREICSVGPAHIAFTVDDLDVIYYHLSQAGVHFNAPPQLSPDGLAKVTFCQDPDGTPIELVESMDPIKTGSVK